MTRTTKLLGPPGTGKTTSALRSTHEALRTGTPPDRIAYTAFTRKAAHEAIDRATVQFGFNRDQFPFFGTLHSLSFRLLGLSPEQVVCRQHLDEIGAKLGPYGFVGQYDKNTERGNPDGELGDVCLFIYQLHRAMLISLEDAWRLVQENPTRFGPPRTGPLPFHAVDYFVRGYEQYKKRNFLLDFSDFLDECTSVLDIDLFVLDEAQDLTPQQWRFARQLGKLAKKVIIAADDDQAVYSWAGCDVEMLFRLTGEQQVLPVSHRLPRSVHEIVARVASNIRRRLAKTYAPRSDEGSVTILNDEHEVDLSKGEWMLLARTNWLTHRLVETARRAGVVYEFAGQWSNEDPTVQAVLAYEKLRAGGRVLASMGRLVAQYTEAHVVVKGDSVEWSDFVWPFDNRPDWMNALHRIGVDQREYIRSLRHNGESLTKPGRIRISTIHAAKGGESDNVMVLGDMGKRVENSFWADMDAELRVWYVALSRARENLFIVQPQQPSPLSLILSAN